MSINVKDDPSTIHNEEQDLEKQEINIKPEKKPDLPSKSSMEILSELFSTFDAEPPLIIKEEKEESSGKKHKKKKHKHKEKKHKKKSKKRRRSNSGSSDEPGKVDLAEILIKQEKDASSKKIKIEGTDLSLNVEVVNGDKEIKDEQDESDSKTPEGSPKRNPLKKNKIVIQDLKNSSVLDSILKEPKSDSDDDNVKEKKHKKKHKHKVKKRSRSKSKDRPEKKKKVNDLREVLRDKERISRDKYLERSPDNDYIDYKSRERERSRDRNHDRHLSEKYKDEYFQDSDDYKRSKRDNPFYKSYKDEINHRSNERERENRWCGRDRYEKSRYRSTSRDRDKSSMFDKKKLLEIARKNAIAMMKSGSLPAALTLGPHAQEKVIAAIKSGGKTIEELTDFCKTLSKKEELGELSSLSEKDDSDSDTDKPFHHPFQIKERPTTITMNIKNSVPLPIKSSLERTTELRMQFPVSSGQHHRKGEEWRPVSPTPPAPPPQKKSVIPVPVALPTIPVIPTSSIPLPPEPKSTAALSVNPMGSSIPPQMEQPISGIPSSNLSFSQTLTVPENENVDIGSIVSQRLAAIRKLQENPNDVQALSQMYQSNKEMQTWASSKQAPLGQYRGSTGAQILSQAELSSGYQAWAKKDQLQTAAPVSGGMGMHLLQKMGWKPGEGLGKEKTGSLEPLLLEVKLDKRGLVANEEQQRNKMKKTKVAAASVKNLQGKHPVSLLGEYASKKKIGAPQYILEFECGPDHKKNFLFKVVLNGVEYKPNIASNNKKEAKAAAASLCLQKIGLLTGPTPSPMPPS